MSTTRLFSVHNVFYVTVPLSTLLTTAAMLLPYWWTSDTFQIGLWRARSASSSWILVEPQIETHEGSHSEFHVTLDANEHDLFSRPYSTPPSSIRLPIGSIRRYSWDLLVRPSPPTAFVTRIIILSAHVTHSDRVHLPMSIRDDRSRLANDEGLQPSDSHLLLVLHDSGHRCPAFADSDQSDSQFGQVPKHSSLRSAVRQGSIGVRRARRVVRFVSFRFVDTFLLPRCLFIRRRRRKKRNLITFTRLVPC